jgi:hypothetical protein
VDGNSFIPVTQLIDVAKYAKIVKDANIPMQN